jgi:hypothetical protein
MSNEKLNADLVMRYRRATGLPVMSAKRALQSLTPDEQLSMVIDTENAIRTGGIARDPLEDDSVIGPKIHAVLEMVTDRVIREYDEHIAEMRKKTPDVADFLANRRGICHLIWRDAKTQLLNEFGIDWKTPAELNPGSVFD